MTGRSPSAGAGGQSATAGPTTAVGTGRAPAELSRAPRDGGLPLTSGGRARHQTSRRGAMLLAAALRVIQWAISAGS